MSDTNDRLNEIIISSIEKLDGAIDKGVDFAVEQAPDLIQQLLLWHGVTSAFMFAGCVVVFVAQVFAVHYFWRNRDQFLDTDSPIVVVPILGVAAMSICIIELFSVDWLKIWLAPKIFLIEYAAGLVK